MNVCGDCGSEHLGADCGMTFAQRIRTVSTDTSWMPARSQARTSYYDDSKVSELFGGMDRHERTEDLYETTKGYGYARTLPNGDVMARDPKTKEPRKLTPKEVHDVYAS